MKEVIESYQEAFKEFGNSPKALFWAKGRQELRFEQLTNHIKKDDFSILDFGCGLAHLKSFLDSKYQNYSYSGVDIVKEFIDENIKNHPNIDFKLIDSYMDVKDSYDYILTSGVFNLKYTKSLKEHKEIVYETISHLFSKTSIALSMDFATDKVDYIQENNYHQNIPELYEFITENLSKRFLINQSYMPYEFSVVIYKNDNIMRPDNVFEEI